MLQFADGSSTMEVGHVSVEAFLKHFMGNLHQPLGVDVLLFKDSHHHSESLIHLLVVHLVLAVRDLFEDSLSLVRIKL